MKAEAQRIAIAGACPNILFLNINEGWCYRTSPTSEWIGCVNNDPLSDLNAMHEAEKVLTYKQWGKYVDYLQADCPDDAPWRPFSSVHATSAQRAEAFLRTLNLWTV